MFRILLPLGPSAMREHGIGTIRAYAWVAGIAISMVAAFGIGALVRTIPESQARVPTGPAAIRTDTSSQGALANANATNSPTSVAAPVATDRRRIRAWCPECGVVESIVEIERYADIGEHGMVPVNIDDDATANAMHGAQRAQAAPARKYAMPIRFRDGSTTVLHEASARDWHPGVRVIVIAGRAATKP
jgi:hypothetical protein